jgi:HK97 family phage major capsid protein
MTKILVEHGDVSALSIYANQLKQNGGNVLHGAIREVSVVLAGANPEALIQSVIKHGEVHDDEVIVFAGGDIALYHAEEAPEEKGEEDMARDQIAHAEEDKEETVADVFNTLNEKQKTVVYAMIGQALEEAGAEDEDDEGDDSMKQNVFDMDNTFEGRENVLSHSEMEAIITDAKRYGSLRDSVLAHGIENIGYLVPDAKALDVPPQFIQRDMGWVGKVMNTVHKTPFSRIKSMFADITEADARAKGYIKGNLKVDEVFSLLKRTTTPTTIYKKQKLERDDVIDITDFDVVAWLKSEMRIMLDEEIARAVLVGDGRLGSSDDKINETNIRPIWKDDDLYTVKTPVVVANGASDSVKAKAFIRAVIKSRKNYKGSGSPTLYTTEDMLTNCLLMEDTTGRVIYDSVEKLATAMRVKEIVTVPVMENLTRVADDTKTYSLEGIVVNLADYNIGADKGGAVNMFDDFDIDYNAQKYLIETRCSGALIKPYAAIAIELHEEAPAQG